MGDIADTTVEMCILEQGVELRKSSSLPAPCQVQSDRAPVHSVSPQADPNRSLNGPSLWGRNCSL